MDIYLQNILNFASQLNPENLQSFNLDRLPKHKSDKIIIVGVGGSGLAGDLVKSFAEEIGLETEVETWKDYGLPPASFYVFVSFSGDTEETLNGWKITPKNMKSAVTSGGKLKSLALQEKCPLLSFPAENLVPRQGTGYMFSAILQILSRLKLVRRLPLSSKLKPASLQKEAKKIAVTVKNKIPLIYSSAKNYPLAYNWKTRFNETAKVPSFCNVLPEMNHNEIVGFSSDTINKNFIALFLEDKSDHPRVQKRLSLTEQILKQRSVKTLTLKLKGVGLTKIWRSILLGDLTAYELAKMNGNDPSATPIIQELKTQLKK